MYSCTEIKNVPLFGGMSEPICELSLMLPACNIVEMDDFIMEKKYVLLRS